jgi:hypothetical protein
VNPKVMGLEVFITVLMEYVDVSMWCHIPDDFNVDTKVQITMHVE